MRHKDYALNDNFKRGGTSNSNRGTIHQQQQTSMKATSVKAITDKEGLDKATATPDKLYVNGDTMYVAGTSYWQDVWDDFKIPFGKTSQAQRYKDADALLGKNPQVSNLVGHSLGGASVLELQKNHGEKTFKTNTYGAPAMSITRPDNVNNHRYRNYGDPISIFNRGAESRIKPEVLKHYGMAAAEFYTDGTVDKRAFLNGALAAHSYNNFDNTKVSDQDYIHHPGVSGFFNLYIVV